MQHLTSSLPATAVAWAVVKLNALTVLKTVTLRAM